MSFEVSLNSWLLRAEKIACYPIFIGSRGRKYIKIEQSNCGVYCFIEKSTGNVLKAATWRKPAPTARGNIYQIGEEGIEKYGAHYLY